MRLFAGRDFAGYPERRTARGKMSQSPRAAASRQGFSAELLDVDSRWGLSPAIRRPRACHSDFARAGRKCDLHLSMDSMQFIRSLSHTSVTFGEVAAAVTIFFILWAVLEPFRTRGRQS